MSSLVAIALALVLALYGVVFGAFLTISFAIRREDRRGSLAWDAGGMTEQSARSITGWHRARWV